MKNQVSQLLPLVKMRQAAIPLVQSSGKETVTSKIYAVAGTQIVVTWREFLPNDNTFLANKAVIFFPGWPLRADSISMQKICEELAYTSGVRTYAIHTRNEQIMSNSLYQEAKAVCKFLEENEFQEITLAGYSQGGIKAVNTIIQLQEISTNIRVNGLILIASVGLKEISCGKLARNYIINMSIISLGAIMREVVRKPSLRKKILTLFENTTFAVKACLVFFSCILKEVRASKRSYFTRFQNDLKEMAKMSPYLDQLNIPIILIQGSKDDVADSVRIVTEAKNMHLQESLQDIMKDSLLIDKNASKNPLIERIFPRSPYVRILEAEKFGTHILPLFRSKSVARVSFYLLQRSQRKFET